MDKALKKNLIWTVGISFGLTFLINVTSGLLAALLIASGMSVLAALVTYLMYKFNL